MCPCLCRGAARIQIPEKLPELREIGHLSASETTKTSPLEYLCPFADGSSADETIEESRILHTSKLGRPIRELRRFEVSLGKAGEIVRLKEDKDPAIIETEDPRQNKDLFDMEEEVQKMIYQNW